MKEDFSKFINDFKRYLNAYFKHNFTRGDKKVAATSDFKIYADSIREMSSGEFFGVLAHELTHNIDDLLDGKSKKKEIIEGIIKEFDLHIESDDYAKWGEAELFADLMAMAFHAKLDSPNRNEAIEDYALRRKLREGLYKPFMRGPMVERGLSIKRPITIQKLPEEYEYIEQKSCPNCSGDYDKSKLQRKSWLVYANRVHDVLRCHCSKCGTKIDYFFDYTKTLLVAEEAVPAYIEQIKAICGEVTDPLKSDFFD